MSRFLASRSPAMERSTSSRSAAAERGRGKLPAFPDSLSAKNAPESSSRYAPLSISAPPFM